MNNSYQNILLVAGTGRKIGKTSLICRIIKKYKDQHSIVALKITPHIHVTQDTGTDYALYLSHDFKIFKEEADSPKDSGRFFKAGANEVIYVESQPKTVAEAFHKALSFIPKNTAIVCESGSLFNYIVPGVFVMVVGNTIKNLDNYFERINKADIVFDSTDISCYFDDSKIILTDGNWEIN